MMKNKIIMAILIIAMILTIGTISSFAEGEANIELNLNGQTTINEDIIIRRLYRSRRWCNIRISSNIRI